jgi:hypothetical protein
MHTSGALTARLIPKHGHYRGPAGAFFGLAMLPSDLSLRRRLRALRMELALRARIAIKGLWRGLARAEGVIGASRLHATIYRADGTMEHLGLLSTRVITDAGVTFLRDDFNNNAQDITTMNFHGCGTGTTAEATGDTALVTESTTALNPDNTRATGTRSTPAGNQYRSVGTATFDAGAAITEHGIFSQAATGGGTLWDRSVFAAINVVSGDSIQFTYTLTLSSGG